MLPPPTTSQAPQSRMPALCDCTATTHPASLLFPGVEPLLRALGGDERSGRRRRAVALRSVSHARALIVLDMHGGKHTPLLLQADLPVLITRDRWRIVAARGHTSDPRRAGSSEALNCSPAHGSQGCAEHEARRGCPALRYLPCGARRRARLVNVPRWISPRWRKRLLDERGAWGTLRRRYRRAASFSFSHRPGSRMAQMFRWLGLVRGPDFAPGWRSLAGITPVEAEVSWRRWSMPTSWSSLPTRAIRFHDCCGPSSFPLYAADWRDTHLVGFHAARDAVTATRTWMMTTSRTLRSGQLDDAWTASNGAGNLPELGNQRVKREF